MNFSELEAQFITHSEGFLKEFIKNCEPRRFKAEKPSDETIESLKFFASSFQFEQFDYFANARNFFIKDIPSSHELCFIDQDRPDSENVDRLIKLNHRVVFLIRKFQQYLPEHHNSAIDLHLSNVSEPDSTTDYYQNYDKVFNVLFDQIKYQLNTELSFDEYVKKQKLYLLEGRFENETRFYQKYRLLQGCLTKLVKENCDFSHNFFASSQITKDQKLLFEKKPNDNIRIDTNIEQFLNWQSSKLEQASQLPNFSYVDPLTTPSPAVESLLKQNSELQRQVIDSKRLHNEDIKKKIAAERKLESLTSGLKKARSLLDSMRDKQSRSQEIVDNLQIIKSIEDEINGLRSLGVEKESQVKELQRKLAQLEQVKTVSTSANPAQEKELAEMRSRVRELEQKQRQFEELEKKERKSEELEKKERELEEQQRQLQLERQSSTAASQQYNERIRSFSPDYVAGSEFYHSGEANTLPASNTAYDYSDSLIGGRSEEMNSSDDESRSFQDRAGQEGYNATMPLRGFGDQSTSYVREPQSSRYVFNDQGYHERQVFQEERIRLEFEISKLRHQQELAARLAEADKNKRDSESKFAEALQKLKEDSDAEKRSSAEDKRRLEEERRKSEANLVEAKAEQEKIKRELEEKFAEELAEAKAAATRSDPISVADFDGNVDRDHTSTKRPATPSTPRRSSKKPLTGSPTSVAGLDSEKDAFLRRIPSDMKRLNMSSNNQDFDDFISLCKKDGADGNESFQVIFNIIQANKSAYLDFTEKLLARLATMSDAEVKKAFQLVKQFSNKEQKHDLWCKLFNDLSEHADYDNIIKQNRAAFIEFAKLSVSEQDTTDAVECFNAIDDQKIQDSISKKIGSHSDLFAIKDGQGPATQNMRQQSSIDYGDQVPLLHHKDGYQPDYYDMTKTSLGGGLALGGLVAAGTIPAFFFGAAIASGAAIALPIAFFAVGTFGSGVYTKLHNNEETKKYNKQGNPVNYQSQVNNTDIVR